MLGRSPPPPLTEYQDWKLRYSSDQDDLVEDFYKPALASARFYDRAVGYFSLSSLKVIGEALEPFWEAGKRMRLVASVKIQSGDLPHLVAAHQGDLEQRQHAQGLALSAEVGRRVPPEFDEPIKMFTAFVEDGLLELYIATGLLREPNASGTNAGRPTRPWFYHEKVGCITDHRGNYLTFEGSPNETASALSPDFGNIESFPVHRSWENGERPHARAARDAVFGLFPPNPTRNVEVVRFPEAQLDELLETYTPERPSGRRSRQRRRRVSKYGYKFPAEVESEMPAIPVDIALHDYQEAAIDGWQAAGGRGRFEMATGTGKTITALAAAVRAAEAVIEKGQRLLIVVLMPDETLVRQWEGEVRAFGFSRPITSMQTGFKEKVAEQIEILRWRGESIGIVISTVQTAIASDLAFIHQLQRGKSQDPDTKYLLIADEAHAFGAPTFQQALLEEEFDYRLALTATFERHFDEEGTAELEQFFAGSVFKVTMDEAINKYKTLVPYNFYPVLVEMTEEEIEEYIDISVSISKVYSQRGNDGWLEFELAGEALLRKRANILKHATHKIGKVREIIQAMPLKSYLLVYAAEGEGPVTEVRQDDQLLELLRDEGLTAYEYDGGTPAQAREYLERQLDDGGIDALVAMRCLDQGVDIPEARAALFVASTTNQRQYIQRRGRILRKPKRPNSDKDHADLYDFIVVPPAPEPERFELERKLVGNEVRRARTLARSAENHLQALNVLSPLLERYGLLDQEL